MGVTIEKTATVPLGCVRNSLRIVLGLWVGIGASGTVVWAHERVDATWAFTPVQRTPLPAVEDSTWPRNPIDRFVLAHLEQRALQPAPEAGRRQLIRRVTLDLIGLPPRPSEIAAFLADDDPQAYERVVERLLASPHYGERWARYWLDLVRYAESDGYKADVYRPHAWRYRDYVVRALNEDLPYDRFLQEQLAGDEMFPASLSAQVATGYLRLWPYEDNQKDVQRLWTAILDEVTEVTAEVVMGLGLSCARCHDHKFDPISQRDYHQLRAFFSALLPHDLELPEEPIQDQRRQAWQAATASIRRAMREVREEALAKHRQQRISFFPEYLQTTFAKHTTARTPRERQYFYFLDLQLGKAPPLSGATKQRYDALQQQLKAFDSQKPLPPPKVMAVRDVDSHAPPEFVAADPNDPVEPGFPMSLRTSAADQPWITASERSTGRRSALATWLTRPDHPLTARVIVNRLWQQHFGVGIVATANDFGSQGAIPTHPRLLDWLASRLVEQGWGLKAIHRLMVTSATYRQADRSAGTRRLDAEQIRDSLLCVSGLLDLRQSGPAVGGASLRRSIYVKQIRNRHDPFLAACDGPDMFNSLARRNVTTTPLQSLLFWNAAQIHRYAAAFADSLTAEIGTDREEIVTRAFQRAYGRPPSAAELGESAAVFGHPGDRQGLVDLCHVLLCSNEFLYVD